jgi:hypothetical protein
MDFSDEPSKTVISITLTFPEKKNKYGKTAHECTIDEIIEYVKQNPKWMISLQTHKYMNIP